MAGRKALDNHTYGFGKIYVVRGKTVVATYLARGGPKEKFNGADRHTHSPIPPGRLLHLARLFNIRRPTGRTHPIPWGARIRTASNREVEYNPGTGWELATGPPEAPMNGCRPATSPADASPSPTNAEAGTSQRRGPEQFRTSIQDQRGGTRSTCGKEMTLANGHLL